MNKSKLLFGILYWGISLVFIAILFIFKWINLADYCTGTGSGGTEDLLFCHEEIWLPFVPIFDIALTYLGWWLLNKQQNNWAKLGIWLLTYLLLFLSLYLFNHRFVFWQIPVQSF